MICQTAIRSVKYQKFYLDICQKKIIKKTINRKILMMLNHPIQNQLVRGEEAQSVYEVILQFHLNRCETFNPFNTSSHVHAQ